MMPLGQQLKKALLPEIEEFGKNVEQSILNAAVITYNTVVDRSPVWSGSYILSHRISINGMPVAPPTDVRIWGTGPIPEKVLPAVERQYREQAAQQVSKIQAHQGPVTSIDLSNDIDHAVIVETTKGAPYAVAAQVARAMIEQVGSNVGVFGRRKKI